MDSSEVAGFKDSLTKDENLIRAAISKYGVEVLVEDRTFDIVSAIVYRKLRHAFIDRQSHGDEEKSSDSEGISFMNVIFVLSFLASLVGLYVLIFGKSGVDQDEQKPQSGFEATLSKLFPNSENRAKREALMKNRTGVPVIVGPFEFQTGDEIGRVDYHGRRSIFKEFYGYLSKFLDKVWTHTREEMDHSNEFSKQNYLLEGPPGTGKTVFVQYLAREIDDYLKLNYLKKANPMKYEGIMNNALNREAALEDEKSRIYYCEVCPGVVNSKWHGESEKNINMLFETAKHLSELDGGRAIFLFFDEGDNFFSKRGGDEGNSASSGLKSELLQRIGVRPKDKYRPIFVFCATNRFEVFDDAFRRRFGVQRRFDLPTENERVELISALLEEFDAENQEIEKIVSLTQGRSQSFISNNLKTYYMMDKMNKVSGFKMREFLEFLDKRKHDKNLQ